MNILCLGRLPEDLAIQLKTLGNVEFIDRSAALPDLDLIKALSGKQLVLTEPQDGLNEKVLAAASDLKMIAQRAVGYDNINLPFCTTNKILVTNTPGVLDNATADLAFSLLLACARRTVEADKYVRNGQWTGFENDLMLGTEISGKTIGIVGMGRIGYAMAKRAYGFDLKIVYCRNAKLSPETKDGKDHKLEQELGAEKVTLTNLLKVSDFISLHCPLNAETKELIGNDQFALMKTSSIFINTSRGKVVNEAALINALATKKIAAAGLDVFYNEPEVPAALTEAANVVLAPHIGSATHETRHAMAELAVKGCLNAFNQILPENSLNPQVWPWAK